MKHLYGGIEAGGTKFVCAVGSGPEDLREEVRFETTTPDETIKRAVEYFREKSAGMRLAAIGIGSFGPIDVRRDSSTYGFIRSTPKPGWSNVDFAGAVKRALDLPVGFDTDVNAAALGEHRWGNARGLTDFIYLTIGTGIGGGGMVNSELMHGLTHPEMGHVWIPHDREADPFEGRCPFHGDCFEGLACGPAIGDRWGQPAEDLPDDHPAWKLEAHYIALALVGYICTLSPQRVIIGGGVMKRSHLFPLVRDEVRALLNDYIDAPEILRHIETYIVPPGLGERAGILGSIALAHREYETSAAGDEGVR